MDHIRKLAWVSIARGCAFGFLAIFCFSFAFINRPAFALTSGGVGMLLMAFILMLKASRSEQLSHKRTEIWIMLEPDMRPPPEVASGIIMGVRRETMLQFAQGCATAAAVCLAGAIVLLLSGFR
jgi:hypothetical protein